MWDNSTTMAPIDDAIADFELREPGDDLTLRKIAERHGVIARRWGKGASSWQALSKMGMPSSRNSTHNKRRDLWIILQHSWLVDYLLQEPWYKILLQI
jgi:hypothetical protein